ncbi:MAG: helix-turn-helix transcriptional regulator [Hyphomicrobiales bacterium]|uniref:helix-turn-helix domain-containing protein n=1 Tax=Alphaproteobacteria TaxID=28211 RepID=UPI0032980601
MEGLAERLREARQRLGLTQAKLAEEFGIPYRTVQDGELGHSMPGAKVLEVYARHNVDVNWLLTGKQLNPADGVSETPTERLTRPIKGKRFRIRSRKLVRIPHYDPLDPDSFNPENPDSVLSIDPSRLTAYNIDYALLGREDAEFATTTVIDERASNGLRKGTLVLFDMSEGARILGPLFVVRDGGKLLITRYAGAPKSGVIVGKVVYAFASLPASSDGNS